MALDSPQLHSRLIRHSPVPQVHSIICLSERQAFPEAKSVESVDFTFYTRRKLSSNVFKPSILLHNILSPLLNTGGKEFIEIKGINKFASK